MSPDRPDYKVVARDRKPGQPGLGRAFQTMVSPGVFVANLASQTRTYTKFER